MMVIYSYVTDTRIAIWRSQSLIKGVSVHSYVGRFIRHLPWYSSAFLGKAFVRRSAGCSTDSTNSTV